MYICVFVSVRAIEGSMMRIQLRGEVVVANASETHPPGRLRSPRHHVQAERQGLPARRANSTQIRTNLSTPPCGKECSRTTATLRRKEGGKHDEETKARPLREALRRRNDPRFPRPSRVGSPNLALRVHR